MLSRLIGTKQSGGVDTTPDCHGPPLSGLAMTLAMNFGDITLGCYCGLCRARRISPG
jgi:hypothetical protein